MLAWIFWHSRFREVPEEQYRQALRAFHQRIAGAAPPGFLGCRTLRYDKLPWLRTATEVFEDWYFVDGSAALDPLDEAALAAFSQDAHARVARMAATATAGIYRLRAGTPLTDPSRCFWISKPRETPYDAFIDSLSRTGTVWSRKMVLGPGPEFCVESNADDEGAALRAEHALRPLAVT